METWYQGSRESACPKRDETEERSDGRSAETGFAEWVRGLGREDDPSGWDLFVRRYGSWLRRRCWYVLQQGGGQVYTDEVDELVQEVYCRLLENGRCQLRCFRGDSEKALLAYLARVARHVVLDHLRYRFAAKRSAVPVVSNVSSTAMRPCKVAVARGETQVELLEGVPCLRLSPERQAVRRQERRDFVRRCRETGGGRSGPRNARIAWLALLEGWSSREIAARVSLTPSAVDTVVYRVRRRLAAYGVEVPEPL